MGELVLAPVRQIEWLVEVKGLRVRLSETVQMAVRFWLTNFISSHLRLETPITTIVHVFELAKTDRCILHKNMTCCNHWFQHEKLLLSSYVLQVGITMCGHDIRVMFEPCSDQSTWIRIHASCMELMATRQASNFIPVTEINQADLTFDIMMGWRIEVANIATLSSSLLFGGVWALFLA